jgi:1,4-alpha-glucan branching enzyme
VIRRNATSPDAVKVTFAVDHAEPVSVVGDFNGWDPHAHPMRRRSNGLRSVAVTLPSASTFRFRYLGAGGAWFDEGATDLEPNGLGGTHSVLRT